VGALTLVEAWFDPNAPFVELTFDRAIDITSLVQASIKVDDGLTFFLKYETTDSASLIGPATVRVAMIDYDLFENAGVLLYAPATTGIVASGDGATWDGASAVALPFP